MAHSCSAAASALTSTLQAPPSARNARRTPATQSENNAAPQTLRLMKRASEKRLPERLVALAAKSPSRNIGPNELSRLVTKHQPEYARQHAGRLLQQYYIDNEEFRTNCNQWSYDAQTIAEFDEALNNDDWNVHNPDISRMPMQYGTSGRYSRSADADVYERSDLLNTFRDDAPTTITRDHQGAARRAFCSLRTFPPTLTGLLLAFSPWQCERLVQESALEKYLATPSIDITAARKYRRGV